MKRVRSGLETPFCESSCVTRARTVITSHTSVEQVQTVAGSRWPSLEADIICHLVTALKQKKTWKRDLASLRLLNSHWRLHVSQHVESLYPQDFRVVSESEALNVGHFIFLTSLDVIPFVKRCLLDIYRAHCCDFFEVLTELPFLRHLRLNKRILTMITAENILDLDGLESVEVMDGPIAMESLNKLATPKLQSLVVLGAVNGLDTFLERKQSLLHLEVEIAGIDFKEAQRLAAIDRVSLRLRHPIVTQTSTDIALKSQELYVHHFETLLTINGLKELSIVVNSVDVLTTAPFKQLVEKLTSLEVTCRLSPLPSHILKPFSSLQLKSLTLRQFSVESKDFFEDVPQLRSLILEQCRLSRGHISSGKLQNLMTLGLTTGHRSSNGTDVWLRNLGRLSGLKRLELFFEVEYGSPGRWLLQEMTKLSSLETVALHCREEMKCDWDMDDGFAFDIFESVGRLPKLTELTMNGWGYRRRLKKIMEMGFVSHLQKLHLSAVVRYEDKSVYETHVEVLRNAAPWLRLEAGYY